MAQNFFYLILISYDTIIYKKYIFKWVLSSITEFSHYNYFNFSLWLANNWQTEKLARLSKRLCTTALGLRDPLAPIAKYFQPPPPSSHLPISQIFHFWRMNWRVANRGESWNILYVVMKLYYRWKYYIFFADYKKGWIGLG